MNVEPPRPPANRPLHWPSVAQFGLSLLAVLGLWGVAASLAVAALIGLVQNGFAGADPAILAMAGSMGFLGLLVLPSARHALVRLSGRAPRPSTSSHWYRARALIWLLPFVLVLGALAAEQPVSSWVLLPPLHLLAITIPIVWVLSVASRGLITLSPQRVWGLLGAGLLLGPGLIIFLELLVGAVFFLVIVLLLIDEPGFLDELSRLQRLIEGGFPNPEIILAFFQDYFFKPQVLVLGYLFIAVFVPFTEELLKPVGLYLLGGRKLTPREGFFAGMLSGAAFSLFESLLQGFTASDWLTVVSGRLGTGLIHILTSGLVGWGVVLGLRKRRYGRMLLHYLAAMLIHGTWNALAATIVLAEFIPASPAWLTSAGISGLFALLGLGFFMLLRMNRRLHPAPVSLPEGTCAPSTPPPPQTLPAEGTHPEAKLLPPEKDTPSWNS